MLVTAAARTGRKKGKSNRETNMEAVAVIQWAGD